MNLKTLGCLYREKAKAEKLVAWCEDFLCENDLDARLAISRSYDYSASISEAVQRIAIDEQDYAVMLQSQI